MARKVGLDRGLAALYQSHQGGITEEVLATAVRAVLGAIYWDSKNEEAVRRAMIQMGISTGSRIVDGP